MKDDIVVKDASIKMCIFAACVCHLRVAVRVGADHAVGEQWSPGQRWR